MPTQSTTPFSPGAVVLTRITFAGGQGAKRRPAVIMTSAPYHNTRADAVVMGLTSNVQVPPRFGECDVMDWQAAGLPAPSKAKGQFSTIERAAIERQLGSLSQGDLARLQASARNILNL
jgi:mRNA interferase MazF